MLLELEETCTLYNCTSLQWKRHQNDFPLPFNLFKVSKSDDYHVNTLKLLFMQKS